MHFGRPINIGSAIYVLKDANEYRKKESQAPLNEREYKMKVSLRVHWLPSGFSTMNVENFINQTNFFKVIDIDTENGMELKFKMEFSESKWSLMLITMRGYLSGLV